MFDSLLLGEEDIERFLLWANEVELTHLQYVDDVLIFSPDLPDMLVFGLFLNVGKTSLIGINCDEALVVQWILGCKMESLPCSFLGFPLGDKKAVSFWEPFKLINFEKIDFWHPGNGNDLMWWKADCGGVFRPSQCFCFYPSLHLN